LKTLLSIKIDNIGAELRKVFLVSTSEVTILQKRETLKVSGTFIAYVF